MTEKAIKAGFANLKSGSDFDLLYASAEKRSQADWLVGINATQGLSIAVGNGIYSLGRVQTPTLAMVCKRYLEHTTFEKKHYFQLRLKHQKGQAIFYSLSDAITDKKEAEQLQNQIEKHPTAEILSVTKETVKESAPLLYDLTALQKHANQQWGFSADETLQIAQRLYEQQYITYPRTGSKYISEDIWAEIPSLIRLLQENELFTFSAKQVKINALNKKIVNDLKVTDHHGLLITERIPLQLAAKEMTIYKMIASRLLEAVSEPCVKQVQRVSLEAVYKEFTLTTSWVTEAGWRGINGFLADSESEEQSTPLPELQKGEILKIKGNEILSKTTQPPKLFTEAGLLSAMETVGKDLENKQQRELLQGSGIGTPTTRVAIIETLLERDYIERKQKTLLPTPKGLQVYDWVKDHSIADVALTGTWEEDLQKIEQGEITPKDFLQAMKKYTQDLTQTLLDLQIPQAEAVTLCCPKCKQKQLKIFEKVVKCPDEQCHWILFRNICGKTLSEEAIKDLIEKKKSPLIKGMKSKSGKSFDAYIVLNENAETTFEFPKGKNK